MRITNLLRATRYATCVACALVVGMAANSPALAQSSVSPELGKPVSAAQDAIKKRQWPQAVENLKTAQGMAKSAKDNYAIDSLLAYVYNEQKNYAEVAKVTERMLNSGQMPADQVGPRTKTLAQLYYSLGKYSEAINWAKKALEKLPQDQDLNVVVMQAYYQTRDYKNAADTANELVANAEKAGRAPQESWLRIAQNSYLQLENRTAMQEVLRKLVRNFQKPDDWALLLTSYRSRMKGDPVMLNYYRLMLDAGTLKQPDDYVEMAQLAMDAGVGVEAQNVIDYGIKNNYLKSTNKTEQGRYERIVASAKTLTAESAATIAKLEADAPNAADGNSFIKLGQIHLGNKNYDKAADAFQKGIKKGGLDDADQAHVLLAMASAKAGHKDQARQALRSVKKDSKWADLAELWSMRV